MNKQFEEWYEQSQYDWYYFEELIDQGLHTRKFNELPFAFQWGVYLEFFDSVGIMIEFTPRFNGEEKVYYWAIRTDELFQYYEEYNKPKEAQQAAINKAFELLNDQK